MERSQRKTLYHYSMQKKTTPKNSLSYNFASQTLNRCSSVEIVHPFAVTEESRKDKPENLYTQDSKYSRVEELEKKLREVEEKYKVDTENMQNYINLLRKKLQSDKNSLKKEKSQGYLSTNKSRDADSRDSASFQIFSTKIQMLSLDKNRLELALLDAEKDMKRLYQEIKYQSEIIACYKEKGSGVEAEGMKQKIFELEMQADEREKRQEELRKGKERAEGRVKEQEQEILYLKEQIRFYEDSDIPKEVKKYQNQKKSEQLLESAKVECKEMIHKFSKEINDKLNHLTLKTQKLENEESKINHLFKLLQHRLSTSGISTLSKVTKECEMTKKELEEALRENYDLHETLEQLNAKSLETQERLTEENKKLKSIIRKLSDMKRLN